MRTDRPRRGRIGSWALAFAGLALASATARGQAVHPAPVCPSGQDSGAWMSGLTVDQIVGMGPEQLDQLYRRAGVGPMPAGAVRGTAISRPGTALARPASKVARLLWQGKVFDPCESTAVNRFFGLKVIRGDVYHGPSWMDGGPALILDYSQTSLVYARYRDEIRQVAPGLYLGLMYARTEPCPTLKMYFLLEDRP